MPHGSHVTYGFFFFVCLTSNGLVQTGHGKTRFSYISVIWNPSPRFLPLYRNDKARICSGLGGLVFTGRVDAKNAPLKFSGFAEIVRIMTLLNPRTPAKMPKQKKSHADVEKELDAFREKRGRGRPQLIQRSELLGRAENYRGIFRQVWDQLRTPLLSAQTAGDVTSAFETHAQPYSREFVPRLAEDILTIVRELKFPKRTKAQANFLADSLAGRPNIEPRTARDICSEERARARSAHRILRKEFYIECSCGYEGPARNDACPKCGAEILDIPGVLWGSGLF